LLKNAPLNKRSVIPTKVFPAQREHAAEEPAAALDRRLHLFIRKEHDSVFNKIEYSCRHRFE